MPFDTFLGEIVYFVPGEGYKTEFYVLSGTIAYSVYVNGIVEKYGIKVPDDEYQIPLRNIFFSRGLAEQRAKDLSIQVKRDGKQK